MFLRSIVAIIVIFIVWSALDFVMHGVLLESQYEQTEELWRAEGDMKYKLIYASVGAAAVMFVAIYAFFGTKGLGTGFLYGLFFGLAAGVPMAYGTYAVMPIPYEMALTWFVGTLVETTLAGLIVGGYLKQPRAPEAPKQEPQPRQDQGQQSEAA